MLFDYVAPTLQPGRAGTVWSQSPLQPLAPDVLTPFSYSLLAELTSRAWYRYYDQLGFEPTPRPRLVRRHKGHAYFNVSLSAQIEADNAGIEPPVLQINQQPQSLASWEKPGFLAGFKLGRAQKKVDESLAEQARQIDAITEKARAWYLKTQKIKRWGQAEILQIMEEIEPVGVEIMIPYLVVRQNLELLYARLLADLAGEASSAQGIAEGVLLINNALCDLDGLVELAIGKALANIAATLREPAQLSWLQAGDFVDWRNTMPSQEAIEQVRAFMDAYGHRALHEGETAQPRWSEDVSLLMHSILAQIEGGTQASSAPPAHATANSHVQKLLEKLPASARKQGEQRIQKMRNLHSLQSKALHALAYIWAGTRTWALAAAKEAMVDNRLQSGDEVFLFELEEIKRLMTGEWNISSLDEIRSLVARRQAEHAAMQQESAPDILVGDDEGFGTHQGLSVVAGEAAGPLCGATMLHANGCCDAVVGAKSLDSGYALTLPFATGYVAAAGTPLDPFVVAASVWQRPVVVGMSKQYRELAEGAQTTVKADAGKAVVSQSD